MDEVRRLAPEHPQWKTQQPFKAVLDNDHKALAEQGMDGLLKIVAATHSGISTEQFLARSRSWLASARHPRTGRPYTEMVFQPMLELLGYLRDNGFDLHRLGRRGGVHARLRRRGLRHSPSR
jgi:hypothetical protein